MPLANDIRSANLAALDRIDAGLAETLRAGGFDGPRWIADRPDAPVLVKQGRSLDSRRDPAGEADRFVAAGLGEGGADAAVLFGLGAGYAAEALLLRGVRVWVLEPDAAVLDAALSLWGWADAIESGRLSFFLDAAGLPAESDSAPLLTHRPTARLEPAALGRLEARRRRAARPDRAATVLVVGPVFGGTLPMLGHLAKALAQVGCRVVEADFRHLAPYHLSVIRSGRPEAEQDRVLARIIDLAGEYTEFLIRTHQPDLLLALAQAPLNLKTLDQARRLGVRTAFWFVEDFRLMGYYREVASGYDHFFHIQGPEAEAAFKQAGAHQVHYLPPAADPDQFRPIDDGPLLAPYQAEVSFMGTGYPNRRKILAELVGFDFKIWGDGWDLEGPLAGVVRDGGRRVTTEETALIFNAAQINLNIHSSMFSDGFDPTGAFVNPRTFEIAACGAFQLVDRRPLLDRHFRPGQELIALDRAEDLPEAVRHYLGRPDLCREIGRRARERVLADHTYLKRVREMLEMIFEGYFSGLA